jgi:uncharacterized protein
MTIYARVKPGSQRPGIEAGEDGTLIVRVRERAFEGQANTAVIAALADHYHVPKSHVNLITGTKSKLKKFEITNL